MPMKSCMIFINCASNVQKSKKICDKGNKMHTFSKIIKKVTRLLLLVTITQGIMR